MMGDDCSRLNRIQVLMSAYNGEAYIRQQLDSILRQQGVAVSVLVRDDGSSDGTWDIICRYVRRFENVSAYRGQRLGAAASFYDLLGHVRLNSAYYAFADQDDVWLRYKLAHALARLEQEPQNIPLLYAGSVVWASHDLKRQEPSVYQIHRRASFGNALAENICMGCTQVFNRELCRLVKEHLPSADVMHDWWMYLTAAYFGRVIYSQRADILYRQHPYNEIGMKNCWSKRWINRLCHIRKLCGRLSSQAAEFQKAYAGLAPLRSCDAGLLRLLCTCNNSISGRVRLMMEQGIYRQNRLDDLIFHLLSVIGFL